MDTRYCRLIIGSDNIGKAHFAPKSRVRLCRLYDLSKHFPCGAVAHAHNLYSSACCAADFSVEVIDGVDCCLLAGVNIINARRCDWLYRAEAAPRRGDSV